MPIPDPAPLTSVDIPSIFLMMCAVAFLGSIITWYEVMKEVKKQNNITRKRLEKKFKRLVHAFKVYHDLEQKP